MAFWRALPQQPFKLHIGCFDQPIEGWYNTDVTPHLFIARLPGAARVLHAAGRMTHDRFEQHARGVFRQVHFLDISKRFPFPTGSAEAIFSAHVLEHLPPHVVGDCLRECRRVLAPHGVFRCGVPDLDLLIARYDENRPDDFVDSVFETRQNAAKNRHYWMYNEASLRQALIAAGFSRVERSKFRQGSCPDLNILDNRPDETLFVEAFLS